MSNLLDQVKNIVTTHDRMIFAAPDLLSALENLHEYMDTVYAEDFPAHLADAARDAIKKAKGV